MYKQGNPRRKGSKFHDEGKWETFIDPLLPEDCSYKTFVEMGCNRGMYLGLAKKKGFKYVYGVEKDKKFLEGLNGKYNILNEEIGKTFVPRHLPVADVTLIANVHYHIKAECFLEYMDLLPYRTLYCLVVSTEWKRLKGVRFKGGIIDVPRYFAGWTIVDSISNVSQKNDRHARNLFSVLLKSNKLIEVDIEEYLKTSGRIGVYDRRCDNFIKKALTIPDFDPKTHPVILPHQTRTPNSLYKLVKSVSENGMKRPVVVSWKMILDGYHRMRILRYLGYKKAIARIL